MFDVSQMGIALSDPKEEDGYFCSEISRGLYDYVRFEVYCKEWRGYKVLKEWRNIELPKLFNTMPIKKWSPSPHDQEWYYQMEEFGKRIRRPGNSRTKT